MDEQERNAIDAAKKELEQAVADVDQKRSAVRIWPYPRKKNLDKADRRRIAQAVLRRVKKMTRRLELVRCGGFAKPTVTPLRSKA